jgi:hypothetical protein
MHYDWTLIVSTHLGQFGEPDHRRYAEQGSLAEIQEVADMSSSYLRGTWLMVMALIAGAPAMAQDIRKPAPKDAAVYIIAPRDGATVKSPVPVRFGLRGMGVAPAGVARENTGHHHVLIDTDAKDVDVTKPLPATDKVKHFGGGQTETMLQLPPGKHTLMLIVGDENHVPFDPPIVSKKITITVK